MLAIASPPSCLISSTTFCAEVRSSPDPVTEHPRSLTTTLAPWLAKKSACSRPMPRPAPVTIATLPSSAPMTEPFLRLSTSRPAARDEWACVLTPPERGSPNPPAGTATLSVCLPSSQRTATLAARAIGGQGDDGAGRLQTTIRGARRPQGKWARSAAQ